MRHWAVMVAGAALAACGGNDRSATAEGEGEREAAAPAAAPESGSAPSGPAGFNHADACSFLSADKVAAVMEQAVSKAELRPGAAATDSSAGFSTCIYKLSDGTEVSLMTRWSPVAEVNAQTVKGQRDQQEKEYGLKTEDVSGVGDIAFWTPSSSQLNVFKGAQKYLIFTLMGTDKAKARERAIALARAAGY
jgi:hypothetical protein